MPGEAAASASQTELERELKQLIVDALKLEDIAPEDIDSDEPLVGDGLGLDSIDILELAMAVHRHFGVKTGSDDSQNREVYGSVRTLATFIRANKPTNKPTTKPTNKPTTKPTTKAPPE